METLKSFIQASTESSAEDPFSGLDVNCKRLLGCEIANHILAYITGATYSDDVVHFDCDTKFSAKEESFIAYLSGYVFEAFYHWIAFLKNSVFPF